MKAIVPLSDLPIKQKKVLMRVDFNVPQDKEGKITDDSRIKASLPSIKWVLDQGGSLILMSHLGRPLKEPEESRSLYSLKPVAERLSELLGRKVLFAKDAGGPESIKLSSGLQPGEVLLLENLRFNSAEEKPEKDPLFAKGLASLGEVYINDAFGSAHRAHSSISEVPKYFEGSKGAGFLLQKEVEFLEKALRNPLHPFIALIGGAKISTKLGVIKALAERADKVLIGGAMAFTLLKARGFSTGDSLVEEGIEVPLLSNCVLPVDFVAEKAGAVQVFEEGIPDGWKGMDIGPKTLEQFKSELQGARMIIWNGPMGVFEDPRFSEGTRGVAQAVVDSKALSIVGGGDSIAALHQAQLQDKITHVSTGGGATLEYLELGDLPGLIALR